MRSKLWTLNGLAVELAMDRRALARKLDDLEPDKVEGRSRLYRLARVFKRLTDGTAAKPSDERARLDRLRADQVELLLQRDRGELIPITDIEPALSSLVIAARNELLVIPEKLRSELSVLYGVDIDSSLVRDHIERALINLSQYEYGNAAPEEVNIDE